MQHLHKHKQRARDVIDLFSFSMTCAALIYPENTSGYATQKPVLWTSQ